MISTREHKLLMVLILLCICTPALSAEPNDAGTELKFEISDKQQDWYSKIPAGEPPTTGSGPIKPTHVAELFVWNLPYRTASHDAVVRYLLDMDFGSHNVIARLMQGCAGKTMSRKQRDFLTTGGAIITVGNFGDAVGNHWHFRLYAVSQDDAKKMAQALLESPTERANERLQSRENEHQERREQVAQLNKEISEKDAKLKATETKLEELRKTVHYLSSPEAEGTVRELNKTLDDLNIEVAGLRAQLEATTEAIDARPRENLRLKLEEMRIEQMVKLKAAEAKKDAATKIRDQAEAFVHLVSDLVELPKQLSGLRGRLHHYEEAIRKIEDTLANPSMDMVPPKVFENKVTIYPVRVD
jgi:hypothetical protein